MFKTLNVVVASGSLVVALSTLLVACRGKEPESPLSPNTGDAGVTSTTSGTGPSEQPNSPDMTKSGMPDPPGRGDPPQILPPEIVPK